MPLGSGSPLEAFKVGQSLGSGQSALGHMVRQVVERFGKKQELEGEYGLKYQSELALEKAKSGLATQRRKEIFGGTGDGVDAGRFTPVGYTEEGINFVDVKAQAKHKLAEATATNQADSIDAAKEGIRTISQMRGLLQVDPQQRLIGNKAAISRSGIPGMFLEREQPDQRDLRSLQGKMHNFVALVRTGRQGLEQQIPFVQEQYNLGFTDPDETIMTRLDAAEHELMTRAGLTQDEVELLRQEGLLLEYQRKGLSP